MFLVAITKSKIQSTFQSSDIKHLQLKPFFITIVTDNFLSKLITNKKGFSVIESPLVSENNFEDVILSQVMFKNDNNTLEIFKPTISGRPIYYHINSDGEFFCSTHIRLLHEAGMVIQENLKALPEFFVYRYVMPPRTLYKDIEQLVAGEKITIELDNGKCQIKSILRFDPPKPVRKNSSIKKISEQTLNLLTEPISALNICKERLSILQSGGLDSSILYQICRNLYGSDETYSTGFPFEDPVNNLEKEYALSASKALKSKHIYYEFNTKEYLHGFIKGIVSAEEPLHHLQSVLLYLLYKRLPQKKDIVISGLGADGIFGPELNKQVYRINSLIFKTALRPLQLLRISSFSYKRLNILLETEHKLNKSLDDPDNIVWSLGCYGSKDWVCNYFRVHDFDVIEGRYSIMKYYKNRSIYDVISLLSFLGSASTTMCIWNKLGQAHGKIVHYPYCNENLINYIFSIPWSLKLKNPKNILREIVKKLDIPDVIVNRPKQSFGIATDKWGKKGGVFEPLIPLCSKIFDIREILKMQSSESEKAMTFWNILNYSVWKRLCINNEPVDVLLDELSENITN